VRAVGESDKRRQAAHNVVRCRAGKNWGQRGKQKVQEAWWLCCGMGVAAVRRVRSSACRARGVVARRCAQRAAGAGAVPQTRQGNARTARPALFQPGAGRIGRKVETPVGTVEGTTPRGVCVGMFWPRRGSVAASACVQQVREVRRPRPGKVVGVGQEPTRKTPVPSVLPE